MSSGKVISGKDIAAELRTKIKERVEVFKQSANTTPHLAVVLASDDPGL